MCQPTRALDTAKRFVIWAKFKEMMAPHFELGVMLFCQLKECTFWATKLFDKFQHRHLSARQETLGEKMPLLLEGDNHWVLLPQFMSNKYPSSLLMDVKPWQRKGNQYKVRPFKCVMTTGPKWLCSQEHTILTKLDGPHPFYPATAQKHVWKEKKKRAVKNEIQNSHVDFDG